MIGHIVGPEIEDGGQNDKNPNPCAISNFEGFKFSIEDFGVSLVFLDNFTLNVDEEEAIFSGTVSAAVTSTPCKVLYGCKPFEENKPPMVVAPRKYKVPVGLKTMIPIGVYDPNDDPVYVWYALNYGGIESHLDYDQDEKIYYLTIRVPEDYSGWEELELTVHVYDLRRGVSVEPPNLPNPGDYYHMVPGRISLKIVRN
ncbi:MAG: hypothetical protein H5T71_00175 [Chloroflexi bacterium]|nr:hypothetical protein [Chloroflexota bacterium]